MAVLPLTLLSAGQEAVVRQVGGGRGVRLRLAGLGFVPGGRVQVVCNESWGPLVVAVGEGRVALGRGLAQKILVEPNPHQALKS
ncbi:MAG: FeoA family protein [Desulfotomaculales bacterium]